MSWKSNILLISCFIYLAHGGIESLSNNSPERESKEVILFDRIASAIFGKEDGLAIGRDKNYLAKKKFPSKTSMKQESTTFEGISNSNEQQFRNNKKKSFQMDRWQTAKPTSMAQLKDLQVQCEIEMMRVRVIFDRPFRGLIFSKGYYSDRKCIHTPSGLGQTVVTFDISLRSCGMVSSFNNDNHSPQGQYIENTIIIQYDPQLQEVWDQARKLRCTWYDFYEKSVTFQPYRVNTLDPVTANFLGDNLRCWMQIQVGKGPHASEVSGIVKIGQTMTMVLGIKDDENKFDMMIRNCVAHDGLRSPITLVNERGCIVRSKIMSNFKKIKNFDVTANVLAFAYFQAFKFPDSMNVHFQCVVQVCRDYCPDPICSDKTDFQVSDAYESNRGSLLSHRNSNSVINPRSIIEPSNLPGAINNKSTRSLESYRSVDDSKKIAREINVKLETPLNNKHDSSKKISMNNSKSNDDKIYLKKSYSERVRNKRNTHSLVQQLERIRSSTARKIETERVDVETKKMIRVVAPSDVQFNLSIKEEEKEVIISNAMESVSQKDFICLNTAAFVATTITFLMILVIAIITIVFLSIRVKILNKHVILKTIAN